MCLTLLMLVCASASLSVFAQDSTKSELLQSSIEGTVTVAGADDTPIVLGGFVVRLVGPLPSQKSTVTQTDDQGHYLLQPDHPGTYQIIIDTKGFKPVATIVSLTARESRIENIRLELETAVQKVTVRGNTSDVSTQTEKTAAKLTATQFVTLPLAQLKFTDALPLVPGVIRTPDGKLNFKGSSEESGMLLLNSTELVDPVTGRFAIGVPVDAIQELTANPASYNAAYGGFSGGLTTIETKPPSGQWHYGLMDFIPGIRGKSGHIVGVADATPRVTFGGPLLPNKVNFVEAFSYEKRNQPVRGLAWPHNETQTQGFNSFSELQATLSTRQLLDVNIDTFPLRTRFANINSLVPQTASSNYGQKGVSVGATDSLQFSSGILLNTVFRYTRFDSNAYGQGPADMLITPEGWGGNFFNIWTRTSNQFELMPALQLPEKQLLGRHVLRAGTDFIHRSYGGRSDSHPVDLIAQDGSLAERISFEGPGLLSDHDTEVAEFLQDNWTVNERLALDLGARLMSQKMGRKAAFAPRAGMVFALDQSRKTVVRAGAGLFYDRVPMLAMDFAENPAQVLTPFSGLGLAGGPPEVFSNECISPAASGSLVRSDCNFGTSPRSFTWNLEVERQLRYNLYLRVSYLQNQTQGLFVVNPLHSLPASNAMLTLSPTGGSHYEDFVTTLHYQPGELGQLNLSYVHSRARGDLNTLSSVFVPFEQPVIRPDATAILNSDVPNRFIGWGEFHLPWHIVVAPVADLHTGFPYSSVDVLQNYVGEPNTRRFPTFFSLDVKVYREVTIPMPFFRKLQGHKFRLGVYSLNVTNHYNPRDVFNNVTSPYFGEFAGLQHRLDGLVIDFVK